MSARENKSRNGRRARTQTRNETDAQTTTPPLVENAAPEKEQSIMSQLLDQQSVRFAAPFVGAAGGALAATIAVERFGMRREVATIGGAVLAIAAAQGQTGLARSLLDGAAMAGVCLGVAEILRAAHPAWIFGNQPTSIPQRQAAPPPANAVTREEFENALQGIHAAHSAELAKREEAHVAQMRDAQTTMHDLLDRLRNADAEIARLRTVEIANDRRRRRQGPIAATRTADDDEVAPLALADVGEPTPDATTTESEEVNSTDAAQATEASEPTEADVDADALAHMREVYALLDDNERRRLSTIVATAPKDVLAREQENLLAMSPADAVAYLRSSVFPAARLVV
jgi:hypothetical protein